jgi:outer membrane protein TolC
MTAAKTPAFDFRLREHRKNIREIGPGERLESTKVYPEGNNLIRSGLAWLAAAVFLLASGCAVDQAREVQTYREVLDTGQAQPPAPFSPKESLTLSRALALANANNEQLAESGEDYLQALINKDRAFARFLPTIRFAPTYMRQEKSSYAQGNSPISKFLRDETLDAPLQGSMNVNPFQDAPALWAAASTAEQRRALLLDHQAILLLDVAQTFYQVMRSEKQVLVLANSVQVQQQRVNDMDVQRRVGVARPVDVAQSEAQLAGTRNALIRASNDVRNGRAMLAQLMGVPLVEGGLAGGFTVPSEIPPADRLLPLADEHRQDLQAAMLQVKAAAEALEAAWGGYFPSISLNLTRYLYRQSFPDDVDWTGLIQVDLPIFSAGLVHANVRTAYSKLRQAHLAESGLRRTVLRELRVAVDNVTADAQQINQLDIRLTAAREALRQADAAYRAGLGTNLQRLIAQDQLLSAELALTEEQFNHIVDFMRLLRVVGVLDVGLTPLPPAAGSVPAARNTRPDPKAGAPETP